MGHRNILCPNQMLDLEVDQPGPGYFHPEPCFHLGGITNIMQPNFHTLAAPGNPANFDGQHLPEHHDGGLFYGRTQYDGVQHIHPIENLDHGMAAASRFYVPYMPQSSGGGMLPVPLNYGSTDQLPSNNYGNVGVSANEYGRHGHLMDGDRGAFKRKYAEGMPGNFHFVNAAAGSSNVVPLDTRHPDGIPASYPMANYPGNGSSSRDAGSSASMRNRPGAPGLEPVLAHNYNPMVQANYFDQPFPPAGVLWFDQQASTNGVDGGASAWNPGPPMPYMHGNNIIGGSMETGDLAMQRYHETAANRPSTSFLPPPPPINLRHPTNVHPPLAPMPVVRGHNINFHPQVAAASYGVPTNYAPRGTSLHPPQDGLDVGPRRPITIPPTGLRIYRPQRVGVVPDSNFRRQHLPHLRVLPNDEVAMLEIPDYYEMGNFVDHHREMRLDIEHMSYEELLALEEQIGSVNTGLSEEAINSQLKTKTFLSSETSITAEEAVCSDQESDSCIVCQEEYKDQEKLGILNCGHEYHVDCLMKWLLMKNVCPICKSEALSAGGEDV